MSIQTPRSIGSGFVFVSSKPFGDSDAFVILGARESEYSHSGMEYVTGVADSLAPDAGWHWGHYHTDFVAAFNDWRER